jgi:hypothetical protein
MCENTDKGRPEENSAKNPLLNSQMYKYSHKSEHQKIVSNRPYISSSACNDWLSRRLDFNYRSSMLNNMAIKLLTRFAVHDLIFNIYLVYYFENDSVPCSQSVVPTISS